MKQNPSGLRSFRTYLWACLLMIGLPAISFAQPVFVNGRNQNYTPQCMNPGTLNFTSLLTVTDPIAQPVTWTIISSTVTGSIAGAYTGPVPAAIPTNPGAAFEYTPSTGFTGTGTITITADNGVNIPDTTTITFTINPYPSAITGPTSVCRTQTIQLNSTPATGTWTTSNSNIATVDNNGLVTGSGNANGPATTFTVTHTLPTGCAVTSGNITLNRLSTINLGTNNLCAYGSSTTASTATFGGQWSSTTAVIATTGGFGNNATVTPQGAGASIISYTMPSGCMATATLTVNPLPDPITGATRVCQGLTANVSTNTAGGTWSSTNNGIATVDENTGVVTGVSDGVVTISYTMPSGCGAAWSFTVNPAASTSANSACLGQSISLSATPGGGTWTTSNTNITLSPSGDVTGVATGDAIVTYTTSFGCFTTTTLTVNPLPDAIVASATVVCQGSKINMSDATAGGMWSTSNANASIDMLGEVTGQAGGSVDVSYTLPTGCYAVQPITVNAIGIISGPTSVCKGSQEQLFDSPAGGTWSSSNANISIDAIGVITGVDVGTATITYMTSAGCYNTRTETVNPLPDPIMGAMEVCVGATAMLSNTGSGVWTSADGGIATVDMMTGEVGGVSAGDVEITYTLPTGCWTVGTLTVHPNTAIIGGNTSICMGATIALSNETAGGTWSTANTNITVDVDGVVTGVDAGTGIVTYTTTFGCTTTTNIDVNPLPGNITGTTRVCEGLTRPLFNATPNGTWTSANTTIATVDENTGVVTGVTGGITTIIYTLPTGCSAQTTFSVNPVAVLSGVPYVCIGQERPLSTSVAGGVWIMATGSEGFASVDAGTGVVTGNSAGLAIVDYTTLAGCVSTIAINVGSAPPITGPSEVCVGSTITLANIDNGGVWSTANTNASVSAGGVVTGIEAGTATITYTLSAGCFSTYNVNVNALPVVATGQQVCVGTFVALAHSPNFGTWSSSNTAVATINTNSFQGRVYGVADGNVDITYTLNNGCATTVSVVVNPLPGTISGNNFICPGITSVMSTASTGGTWSSTNVSNATVNATTGEVLGVSTGFAQIRYTLPTGCFVGRFVLVSNNAPAITGPTPSEVCVGETIDLNNVSTTGTWSSSLPGVGTVDGVTGEVTGVSSGTTIITYSLGTNCRSTRPVQVNALSDIIGSSMICSGDSTTLSNSTFGGAWASSNGDVATVDPLTGLVVGTNMADTADSTIITYTLPSGCNAALTVWVNPGAKPITGIGTGVCLGSSITLSNAVLGGTWSTLNTAIATVDPMTGVVMSVTVGTTSVVYTPATGCKADTATLKVNPLPLLTSEHTMTVCNNTLVDYTPTSDIGSTDFKWQRLAVAGISNAPTTGTGNPNSSPSTEQLNNTTTAPVVVLYAYELKVPGTECVTLDTLEVTVNPSAQLTSPTANGPVCDSEAFTYTSTSDITGTTFTWSRAAVTDILPATGSGAGDVFTENLDNTGILPRTVVYVDSLWYNGCVTTHTFSVIVNPTPVLTSADTIPSVCDSVAFTYTSTSATPGVDFAWSRAAVAGIANPAATLHSDVINETLYNTTANPIVVTYIDSLFIDQCWHTQEVKVTIYPTPKLSSNVTPPAICDSTVFSYNPTSATAGTTFTWTRDYTPGIGLLAGSGTGNPNEVLVNTTNINVAVTYHYTLVSPFGCDQTQDVTVIVHPRPRLSSAPGPFSVCSGTAFSYGPTGYVTGTTFAWSRPYVAGIAPTTGSGTGGILEVLVDSNLLPKNVVYKYVMTANGCKDSTYINLTVKPAYNVPEITVHPPSEVCVHTKGQLFGLANYAPEGVEYAWSAVKAKVFATGTPDRYAIVDFDTVGTAIVKVTTNTIGYGCTNSSVFFVNVTSAEAPILQIIYHNGQFMCLNNDQATYQWGYDDAITLESVTLTGETNQTYFNSDPVLQYRKYWCVTKTHEGCIQKTYYNMPVGVNDITDGIDVKVYPNPANDILNVDINTKAGGKIELEVVDVLGQKISAVTAVNHKAQMNVSGLAPGVYVIECYRDGVKVNATRFIKN